MAFQTKSPSNNAVLVVTRDEGFIGSGCYTAFWINGTLSGRFETGETAEFYVGPGDYLLKTGRDPLGNALCGNFQDNWTQRETSLRANERKVFRLTIDMNAKHDVERAE